jgi:hypothetical protein
MKAMQKYNINSKGEADHLNVTYYVADDVDTELATLRARIAELEGELRETAEFAHILCIEAGQTNHTGHFDECDALVCKESRDVLNKATS